MLARVVPSQSVDGLVVIRDVEERGRVKRMAVTLEVSEANGARRVRVKGIAIK